MLAHISTGGLLFYLNGFYSKWGQILRIFDVTVTNFSKSEIKGGSQAKRVEAWLWQNSTWLENWLPLVRSHKLRLRRYTFQNSLQKMALLTCYLTALAKESAWPFLDKNFSISFSDRLSWQGGTICARWTVRVCQFRLTAEKKSTPFSTTFLVLR